MQETARKTKRMYNRKTPAESEIFEQEDKLLKEAADYFKTGEVYELPLVFLGAGASKIDAEFEYLGTAGNNTKLQFREIHGGWTATFAPIQLMGLLANRHGNKKPCPKNTARLKQL